MASHTLSWLFITLILAVSASAKPWSLFSRSDKGNDEASEILKADLESNDNANDDLQLFHDLIDQIVNGEYSNLVERELQIIYDFMAVKAKLMNNTEQEHNLKEPTDFIHKLNSLFDDMFQSLEREGYNKYGVWITLEAAQRLMTVNHNYVDAMAHIQSVLHEIRPFNIQYMVHLYKLTQTTAHMLAKQDTVLFLGYTGSGKSTTIHFMCGSKFHRNIDDHFEVIDPAKACEAINTRYAVSESVTKSIAAVSINLKDYGVNTYGTDAKTNVMLCDTPGFLDAGGPEIDVANGLGIVNAVRKAKSLRIIITVDWMACTGNRMDALKKLAYTLANIVPNYKKYQSYIDFIFTKVPPKEQDYTKIRRKVEQALEENQKQNAHDSALIDFLLMLRNNRNPIFLNPMQSDLKETMQDLFVGKDWISVPSQVIKSFVTDESMMQIKQQISKHKQYIMRTMNRYQNARHDMGSQCTEQTQCSADSVGSGLEFALIDIKLSELSQLHQCLPDIQIIKDTLNECIEIIRKAFNMKINEAITKLSNSNRYHNIYEFEKSIINFKMITNDMGAMMNLQQKHFENNIGASPLLLNESLREHVKITSLHISVLKMDHPPANDYQLKTL